MTGRAAARPGRLPLVLACGLLAVSLAAAPGAAAQTLPGAGRATPIPTSATPVAGSEAEGPPRTVSPVVAALVPLLVLLVVVVGVRVLWAPARREVRRLRRRFLRWREGRSGEGQ